jgi:hypothetical protein
VTATQKEFITIVSGLPRSGTSMLMCMLEAGGMPVLTDNLRRADEDNPKGYYEFELAKRLRTDRSWLSNAYGKAVKIIYLLLYELPTEHEYRVIFVDRILEEVLASQKIMLQRQGKESDPLSDTKMARLFSTQLEALDAWIQQKENFRVLHVNYNGMLETPKNTVIKVGRFLDLALDTDAMVRVVDKSLYRQKR